MQNFCHYGASIATNNRTKTRAHSFLLAAEFQAKLRNFPTAAECPYFHKIMRNLMNKW